ncbi:hypothetical protein L6452_42500 [Arctium lappa]|uniref:Uncharacterized protein n=1 Tax=Arctium lappa TaxID=4217 RepID=A0ACB8XJM2_ARCLA|nr:hypothetical protein L6452_42500 [Arctium lappa]
MVVVADLVEEDAVDGILILVEDVMHGNVLLGLRMNLFWMDGGHLNGHQSHDIDSRIFERVTFSSDVTTKMTFIRCFLPDVPQHPQLLGLSLLPFSTIDSVTRLFPFSINLVILFLVLVIILLNFRVFILLVRLGNIINCHLLILPLFLVLHLI